MARGINAKALRYLGRKREGCVSERISQPRQTRSAHPGIRTWSPLKNPMAAPMQQMVVEAGSLGFNQAPSFS